MITCFFALISISRNYVATHDDIHLNHTYPRFGRHGIVATVILSVLARLVFFLMVFMLFLIAVWGDVTEFEIGA